MKRYRVITKEVKYVPVCIDAKNEVHAIHKVASGEGDTVTGEVEYTEMMDQSTWTVELEA